MSPEQLKNLSELTRLFETGQASPKHIKQLSTLLAEINQANDTYEHESLTQRFTNQYIF